MRMRTRGNGAKPSESLLDDKLVYHSEIKTSNVKDKTLWLLTFKEATSPQVACSFLFVCLFVFLLFDVVLYRLAITGGTKTLHAFFFPVM